MRRVWVLAFLLFPASAHADVSISGDQVVVSSASARAVVTRHPFRLTIADRGGRTVLGEVANSGQAPFPVAPAPDPVLLGLDTQKRPALYAPLAFTVGASRHAQYPA